MTPQVQNAPNVHNQTSADSRRRVLRSQDDRMIGGVAAGFGDYFNIDPMIVRLLFGISLIFFLFPSVLIYFACVLLIPNNVSSGSASGSGSSKRILGAAGITALVITVAVGAFLLMGSLAGFGLMGFDFAYGIDAFSLFTLATLFLGVLPFVFAIAFLVLVLARRNSSGSRVNHAVANSSNAESGGSSASNETGASNSASNIGDASGTSESSN